MFDRLLNSQAIIAIFISILSFLISVIALIINYLNYKRYAPKLTFTFLPDYSCIVPKSVLPLVAYSTDEFMIVSYKISNTSAQPITIDEVNAKPLDLNALYKPHHEFEFEELNHTFGNKFIFTFTPKPCAKLPLRIEPFDSVYVSFRFPFSHELFKPVTLKVVTPLKTYTLTDTPFEWSQFLDLYYHELQP